MEIPLFVIGCFFLVAFNVFSLIFYQFDYYVSRHVPPQVYSAWDLCFLELGDCFLYHVRDVFSYYHLKYFLWSFLFAFSLWGPL